DAVFGNHGSPNSIYINGAPKPQPRPGMWVRDIGTGGGGNQIYFPPAITNDGTIIGGSNGGKLVAFRPDGSEKWSFTDGDGIRSTPAIGADGTVYVGTLKNSLVALDPANGNVLWRYTATSTGGGTEGMRSPGIAADGTIYIGSTADDTLYEVDDEKYLEPGLPRAGAPYFEVLLTQAASDHKWRYDSTDKIWGSPAIAPDGTIYIGSDDDGLHAVNPTDGTRKWRFDCGGKVYSSPALALDGTIYVGSLESDTIWAITDSGASGTQKGKYVTGGDVRSSPAIGVDGTVYCGSNDDKLYAFTDNGPGNFVKKWEFPTPGGDVWAAPSVADDDTIVVGSRNSNLYGLTDNGGSYNVEWTYDTGTGNLDNTGPNTSTRSDIYGPVVVGADGTIYFGTEVGEIHTVHPEKISTWPASTGLANSAWPKFRQNYRNTGRVEPPVIPPAVKQFSPFGFLSSTDTNNTNALAIGDLDFDGDLDVAVGDQGAINKIYLNNPAIGTTGTGNFTLGPAIIGGVASDTVGIALVDMAGDKRVLLANQKLNHHAIHLEPLDGNQSGKLQYYTAGKSTPAVEMTMDRQWSESEWHHIVVVRSNTTPTKDEVSIYVDGLQTGAAPVTLQGNGATGTDLRVDTGFRAALDPGQYIGKYPYKGAIDDIRVYDRALSGGDVTLLYNGMGSVDGGTMDLATGMIAWWQLDNSALDSANVHDMHGTPIGVTGANSRNNESNGSYEFNATKKNMVIVGKFPVLNLGGNATISLWVGPPSTGSLDGTLISKSSDPGDNRGWKLDLNAGKVRFHTSSDGTAGNNDILTSSGVVNDGQWHHVVAELTDGEKRIYIDGVLDSAKAYSGGVFASSARFLFGSDDLLAPTAPYNGRLDQVRIFDVPLNAMGVEKLYINERPGNPGQATITVNFVDDLMEEGDKIRLELYDTNDTSGTPFRSWDIEGSSSAIKRTFSASKTANAWQPPLLQGGWKVTSLAGTVTVDNVFIQVQSPRFNFELEQQLNRSPARYIYGFNAQMNRDVYYGAAVQLSQANAGYTFSHEVGHLLSASHASGDDGGIKDISSIHTFNPYGGVYNYVRDEFISQGNSFTGWGANPGQTGAGNFGNYCTVMAVPGTAYTRIPRFSNPLVYWKGAITGQHHNRFLPPPLSNNDRPLYSDNARAITIVGNVATLYRDSNGTGRTLISDTERFIPPKGVPNIERAEAEKDDASEPEELARTGSPVGSGSTPTGKSGLRVGGSVPPSGVGGTTQSGSQPKSPAGSRPGGGGIGGSTNPPSEPEPTDPPDQPKPEPAPPLPGGGDSPRPGLPGGGGSPRPGKPKPGTPTSITSTVPNDNLDSSFVLQLNSLRTGRWLAVGIGHNMGATAGEGETAGVQSTDGRRVWHGRSVWWVVQAPGAGIYEIDASTAGSGIDTTLSVVQPGGDTSSNDNDRRQPTPASRVFLRRVTLKKGDKVYFSVDGVNGAQGQIKLTVKLRKLN
ncbi:MAG: PQQ-binding-like beta-propeller repeat protein, partial [Verrucomicrobiota bacterium]|nr:PQQ-binding-like beta-propeller repeat protein [Verrucomicrobiota bacterium]